MLKYYSMANTRKNRTHKLRSRRRVPWAGWDKEAPEGRERTKMFRKCGEKCFLGPNKSFPICSKNTCRVNPKGVYAAYVRSRQWGKPYSSYKKQSQPSMARIIYDRIAKTAKRILSLRGYKVGERSKTRFKRS